MSDAAAKSVTTYDAVEYAGYPFGQTHPDRLATLGTLFGLQPAPAIRCRMLELGCGDGANLIPMAFGLPDSSFVGIDLAARPIAAGQHLAAELGLENIEFRAMDIAAADKSLGRFDYIIAHGVYSWVPESVRERILALCNELLTAEGIAYISYNAQPGCYLRDMAREMMRFHVRGIEDPMERVEQGLALLKLIRMKFPSESAMKSDLYGAVIAEQLERMEGYRDPEQVFHDELAEVNAPFFFHEFIGQASRHGLQYLAEANFFEMQDYVYPEPVRDFLRQMNEDEVVTKEQYLDFLKCRGFRQTLLCRKEAAVRRSLDPRCIAGYRIESHARPESAEADLRPRIVMTFRAPRGARLQTDHQLAKAALLALGEHSPRALAWEELLASARAIVASTKGAAGAPIEEDAAEAESRLAEILLAGFGAGVVELHAWQPPLVLDLSDRPAASRLALLQAGRGGVVTNLLHENVEFDDALGRRLLSLLDGTRDRAALLDEMLPFVLEHGSFTRADGSVIENEQELRAIMANAVEANLRKIARMALLVG